MILIIFQELKLKDEECKKLAHVQDQMGQELEDLTASLFEVGLLTDIQLCWLKYGTLDKHPGVD